VSREQTRFPEIFRRSPLRWKEAGPTFGLAGSQNTEATVGGGDGVNESNVPFPGRRIVRQGQPNRACDSDVGGCQRGKNEQKKKMGRPESHRININELG
jgi:hypothetical protein